MIEDIPNFKPSYSYDVNANDVIKLKLIRNSEDFDNKELSFKPEFTHQIFGQDERILGYHGLEVKVYYIATTLDVYIGLKYISKASPQHTPIESTPIEFFTQVPLSWESNDEVNYKPINHIHFTERKQFLNALKRKEHLEFTPPGRLVRKYCYEDREFEIYRGNMSDQSVRDYHMRFQTFLLFFIEQLSYIDDSDHKWEIFFIFEKVNEHWYVVGYTNVYSFFAYPDKQRFRVSQFLILPPFQRQGHGGVLLETVYRQALEEKGRIVEVCVEEPSRGMCSLMDQTDFRIFHSYSEEHESIESSRVTDELWTHIRSMTMIPKPRLLKCYEMYKYLKILERKHDENNPQQDSEKLIRRDMKKFRIEVKRRFFNSHDLKNTIFDDHIRKAKLQEIWLELSKKYRKTLKRYVPGIKKNIMKDEDEEEEEEEDGEEESNKMIDED